MRGGLVACVQCVVVVRDAMRRTSADWLRLRGAIAILRRLVAAICTADAKRAACAFAWNRVDDTSGKQDPRCQKDQRGVALEIASGLAASWSWERADGVGWCGSATWRDRSRRELLRTSVLTSPPVWQPAEAAC